MKCPFTSQVGNDYAVMRESQPSSMVLIGKQCGGALRDNT